MRQEITSLPALVCFRAAAEMESFSRAAERLNLSHGAISRAVRLLEDDLGTALFTRRNRSVFLTDDGRRLAQAVAQGLGQIETTIRDIRSIREKQPVTVSCEPTLMMRWLIPRLPSLRGSNPECDVRLVAGGGPVVLGNGIDLAIRRDDFTIPKAYRRHALLPERIGPVCRSDLVDRFFDGSKLRPEALLLQSQTRPSAWNDWADRTGISLAGHSASAFEHFYFSLQAAVAGLGVAIGPWQLVQDDLNAGLLAAPAGFVADGTTYLLLSQGEVPLTHDQSVFQDWLDTMITS